MISNELNFPVSSLEGSAGFWLAAHVKDFLLPWDGALFPSLSPIRFPFTDFLYLCCSNVKALSYLTHFSQSSGKCVISREEKKYLQATYGVLYMPNLVISEQFCSLKALKEHSKELLSLTCGKQQDHAGWFVWQRSESHLGWSQCWRCWAGLDLFDRQCNSQCLH